MFSVRCRKQENFFHRVLADKETVLHVEKRCKCEVLRMILSMV